MVPEANCFLGVKGLEFRSQSVDLPNENQAGDLKFNRRPEVLGDEKRLWRGCKSADQGPSGPGWAAVLGEAGMSMKVTLRAMPRGD